MIDTILHLKRCPSEFDRAASYSELQAIKYTVGVQWLSGRVLDLRPRGRGFEPHRCHCFVVLEDDTFILA